MDQSIFVIAVKSREGFQATNEYWKINYFLKEREGDYGPNVALHYYASDATGYDTRAQAQAALRRYSLVWLEVTFEIVEFRRV